MAKDAYYFSHDSNARFDPRILKLRAKFGLEGYGFYFAILEIMRDSSDYTIDNNEIDTISYQLQIDDSKAKAMLEICLEVGLFLLDENNKIYSESFLNRMQEMNELRAKRQAAGAKGGKAKAKLKQNDSIKGKEKKVKESKVVEETLTPAEEFKIFGEYENIFLSEQQRKKLDTEIMHVETVNNLIEELSQKVAEGKEDVFDGSGNHFARLRAFWKYRKEHPEKFREQQENNSWQLMG